MKEGEHGAQVHVACAIPNTLMVERIGTDEMNAMWERAYGSPDFWLRPDADGMVGPPDVPGMGVEIDRGLLGTPLPHLYHTSTTPLGHLYCMQKASCKAYLICLMGTKQV